MCGVINKIYVPKNRVVIHNDNGKTWIFTKHLYDKDNNVVCDLGYIFDDIDEKTVETLVNNDFFDVFDEEKDLEVVLSSECVQDFSILSILEA